MHQPVAERRRAPVIALSAGILLAGCTSVSEYQPPQMRVGDRYGIVQPIAVSPRAQAAWWRAFEDPVLDALIARALAQNLTIADARARVREAEALARRSGLTDLEGDLDVTADSDGSETVGFSLGAIFSPRKLAEVAASRARLAAAREAETNARRLVVGELALAYVDLRFSQQLLEYRRQDERSRRRTLNDIEAQVAARAATRLDSVRARALLAQTVAQIPQTESQIAILQSRIATLLGEPVALAGIDLRATGRQPTPNGGPDIGVPADLMRARPDIREAERRYAAAISDLDTARAARYPRLSLSGLVRAPLEGGGTTTESLELGLILPVLSQPQLAASQDAAEARVEQALIAWRAAVLTAVDEVESALVALAASRRAVSAAAEVVRLNQEALDLSRQLFLESGETTVLDVLDRERSLSDARAVLAQAKRDMARDYIRLYTALGLEDGFGAPGGVAPADLPYTAALK